MTKPRTFLDGRVTLWEGDCREVLKGIADNSVDSVVTDPPYGINFMNRKWDDNIAFQPEVWADVCRVMKPGAHAFIFGGDRTYHRLVCAVEDGGLEIRRTFVWAYGSGFPKSLNISKHLDKRKEWNALPRLQSAIRSARNKLEISQSEAARRMGLIEPHEDLGGGGFMWFETGLRMPTSAQWKPLKDTLSIGDEFDSCFEEAEREITGTVEEWTNRSNYALTSKDGYRRDKATTSAAREWDGWGTDVKPAIELVCLARKPLSEPSIAANILRWGTGGLNVGACKIQSCAESFKDNRTVKLNDVYGKYNPSDYDGSNGRWPANLLHDGSDEVMACFPESKSCGFYNNETGRSLSESDGDRGVYGNGLGKSGPVYSGDSGSAARFFASFPQDEEPYAKRLLYHAKADYDDRLGSRHPTVKPLALIQELARLITPRNGVCLDLFAGTGITGEACFREGFRSIIIEREAEYIKDIERRMSLVMEGPVTRANSGIKARNRPRDDGPLFNGVDLLDIKIELAKIAVTTGCDIDVRFTKPTDEAAE